MTRIRRWKQTVQYIGDLKRMQKDMQSKLSKWKTQKKRAQEKGQPVSSSLDEKIDAAEMEIAYLGTEITLQTRCPFSDWTIFIALKTGKPRPTSSFIPGSCRSPLPDCRSQWAEVIPIHTDMRRKHFLEISAIVGSSAKPIPRVRGISFSWFSKAHLWESRTGRSKRDPWAWTQARRRWLSGPKAKW